MLAVRPIRGICIWVQYPDEAQSFIAAQGAQNGIPVEVVESIQEAALGVGRLLPRRASDSLEYD